MLEIETVAVLGASEAGARFAMLAALAGCEVRVHDPRRDALEAAIGLVRTLVDAALVDGQLTSEDRQRIFDGVRFTSELDEAVTAADLVLDAAGEGAGERLARLTGVTRASSPLATLDTPPAELDGLPQPARVMALRLLPRDGQAPRLQVLPTSVTAAHALARAEAFVLRVNQAARPRDAA